MIRNYVREKRIYCGKEYSEVDIIQRTETGDKVAKSRRGKRVKESEPKQKSLNEKNSRRYLTQLGNGNFTTGDYHVSLTYSDNNLPGTVKESEKIISNYLLRLKRHRKKVGANPLKYILVTEYNFNKKRGDLKRIHHHLIINGGIDRDIIEDLWSLRRKKGEKQSKRIGYINADRIQIGENGIEALCKYITKDPAGKKRWTSSRNLIRPEAIVNDRKFSKRKIERLAKSPTMKEEIQKNYPGYKIIYAEAVYYECTGWHIYLKMWKRKD